MLRTKIYMDNLYWKASTKPKKAKKKARRWEEGTYWRLIKMYVYYTLEEVCVLCDRCLRYIQRVSLNSKYITVKSNWKIRTHTHRHTCEEEKDGLMMWKNRTKNTTFSFYFSSPQKKSTTDFASSTYLYYFFLHLLLLPLPYCCSCCCDVVVAI